jgi:ATP-dependent Clp protease ATP-binding subunit ClpA
VDEAASALRLAQESKPDELEALDRDLVRMEIELESLKAETDVFSVERRGKIEKDLKERKEKAEELTAIWQNGTPYIPRFCGLIRMFAQSVPVSIASKTLNYALKKRNTSSKLPNVTGITNELANLGSQLSQTLNVSSLRNQSSRRMARRPRVSWR